MRRAAKALLSCVLLILPVGCQHETQAVHAVAVATGLKVAEVRVVQVPSASPLVGTVRAEESASLSSQVVGRVTAVLVREGDMVRAGQTLVRLDDGMARASVTQAEGTVQAAEHNLDAAEAQAALAVSTLTRYQMLRDQKSVSLQEFDEVSRRSEAATAQLAVAQAQLTAQKAAASAAVTMEGYSTITAPFAGVVTARHVDPGALASPGTALVDVNRAGPLQLVVTVDESLLRDLQPSSALPVSVPAAAAQLITGRVAQIVPAADAASHSFQVKIDLPALRDLLAGMYGTTFVSASTRAALLAPQAAVVAHGSIHSVWVVDAQHIAALRYVAPGSTMGSDVEILSGLSAGEQVVLSPGDRELGGMQIEAKP